MLARAPQVYEIEWANNYQDGRAAMLRDEHDVFLVDYKLPDHNGIDLVREITAQGIFTPVIVITSYGEQDIDLQALEAGAADYVDKGELSTRTLHRAIRYTLEHAHALSERKAALVERDQSIERLTILRQIDDELSQKLSVDYVMVMALDTAVRLSAADAGFVGLIEGDQVRLSQAIGHYEKIKPGDYLPDTPFIRRIKSDMEARFIPDVEHDPDTVVASKRTRSQMVLPLIASDNLIGILNLEAYKTGRFTPEIFAFLKLIAARVAVAVDNARLYKISQDQLAQLRELYAQVSSLEQLKTDMIRIASHDLRNPVGVILGYIELIQQFSGDTLDPKLKNFLEIIERSAHRMEKITTDILSLERIESSFRSKKSETLNLCALVYEVCRDFGDQAQARELALKREIPDEAITVRGDSVQLREAIGNFITNAIKYTPPGGSITVALQQEKQEAVLRVIDTGYGIPEDQQDKLFQAFHRVESEQTAAIEGTGLGLYLVRNIVERHGGALIFESIYGKGSTFGFRLPVE